MKSVSLEISRGMSVLIDEDDYEHISKNKWQAQPSGKTFYAFRTVWITKDKSTSLRMHRLIMDANDGESVDHINGDGLDNRKENLRICTSAQNQHNRSANTGRIDMKGVYWVPRLSKWRSMIRVDGRLMHLGMYADPLDAKKSYNDAAEKYFGEFAKINNLVVDGDD